MSPFDPRLIAVAEALGIVADDLSANSLREAVADAVQRQGLPHIPEVAGLFAELVLSTRATPRAPPKLRERKRNKLFDLREELQLWLDGEHRRVTVAYRAPEGAPIDGIRRLAERLAERWKQDPDTVEKWCHENAEARALIASFRPVRID